MITENTLECIWYTASIISPIVFCILLFVHLKSNSEKITEILNDLHELED